MKDQQASSTAYTVMQGVLYIANHPHYAHLVSQEIKEAGYKLLSATPKGQQRLRQLDNRWFNHLIPVVEKLLLPNITLHYVMRKRCIEKETRELLKQDVEQVVVLGAGLDTLACRLAEEFPNALFYEIDHPATHADKCSAVSHSNLSRSNLELVSADLSKTSIGECLNKEARFKPSAKTLFLIEGVLMYLTEVEVRCLLRSIRLTMSGDTHVLFTAVEEEKKHRGAYGILLKAYLTIKGESLKWLCNQENIRQFIERQGYQQLKTINTVQHQPTDRALKTMQANPEYINLIKLGH